jgi:hypothetical protein
VIECPVRRPISYGDRGGKDLGPLARVGRREDLLHLVNHDKQVTTTFGGGGLDQQLGRQVS